ncbi:MAG TPA: HAD family hydrolase [Balneolaceae bacterium]|nr:HAD family hydrolase [Balneolaceae bacterium]
MPDINVIAFDADDTLWVNEPIFNKAEEKCKRILSDHIEPDRLSEKLYETEIKNLKIFGYGIKGFVLSLIETAVELSGQNISGHEIQEIINVGKEMTTHPVNLLPCIEQTVCELKAEYTLMIITKGDLFDQESKIARSGLDQHFDHFEIVSSKTVDTYLNILNHYSISPSHFLMVGNSLKSDVLPVTEIGAHAIHIPFHTTWEHEKIETNETTDKSYIELEDISLLPKILESNF